MDLTSVPFLSGSCFLKSRPASHSIPSPLIGYWGQEVDEPQVDSHPEAAPSCSGLGGRQMPKPLRSGIFTHELGRPPMLASEVGRAGCSETGQRGSMERIHAALHPRRAGGPCRLWAQAGFVLKRGCLHPQPFTPP